MKQLTEIIFILDRSGSMSGLEGDTIGGFNSLIEKQKHLPGEALISTVLFDDTIEILHNRVPLHQVRPMTREEYYVRGCTALLDAIGSSIDHIITLRKKEKKEMQPEKTLFIITTDGMENSSSIYTYDKVKEMIERQKKTYLWEFLFLGANIDAAETANKFGIEAEKAANFHCDAIGTSLNYSALSDTLCQFRKGKEITSAWKSSIDDDYEKRKK